MESAAGSSGHSPCGAGQALIHRSIYPATAVRNSQRSTAASSTCSFSTSSLIGGGFAATALSERAHCRSHSYKTHVSVPGSPLTWRSPNSLTHVRASVVSRWVTAASCSPVICAPITFAVYSSTSTTRIYGNTSSSMLLVGRTRLSTSHCRFSLARAVVGDRPMS